MVETGHYQLLTPSSLPVNIRELNVKEASRGCMGGQADGWVVVTKEGLRGFAKG